MCVVRIPGIAFKSNVKVKILLLKFWMDGLNRTHTGYLLYVDQKSFEIKFLISICCPTGNKWQAKTLFLAFFDPCSSIVKSLFRLPPIGVMNGSAK